MDHSRLDGLLALKAVAKPSGLLRLNVPRTIYGSFLEPVITSFRKKYPEVCVEVYFED